MSSLRSLLRTADFDDPKRQQQERRASVPRLHKRTQALERTRNGYTDKLARFRYVLKSSWSPLAIVLFLLALAAVAADVYAVAWTAELPWPDTPWRTRLGYAALIVSFATFVVHLIFTCTQDPDRTGRTLRRHLWFAIPCATAAAACALLIRSYPFLTDAVREFVAPITWTLPIILNLSLPVAAGSLSSIAHYFLYPRYLQYRKDQAERELVMIHDHLADLEAEATAADTPEAASEQPASTPSNKGNGRAQNPLHVITPAIALLMILVPLATGCASESHAQLVDQIAGAEVLPARVVCRIDTDRTATLCPIGRQDAHRRVAAHLRSWTEDHGCTELLVSKFGNEGAWRDDVGRFLVPQPRCRDTAARDAPPAGKVESFHDLLNRDLAPQASAEPTCTALTDEDRGTYADAFQAFQGEVLQALTVSDNEVARTGTTDIYGVLVAGNFSDVTGHLVVTDALDNHHQELPPLSLRDGYYPEFILAPPAAGHSWATSARVHERIADFHEAIPGLRIRVYTTIDETTWGAP